MHTRKIRNEVEGWGLFVSNVWLYYAGKFNVQYFCTLIGDVWTLN